MSTWTCNRSRRSRHQGLAATPALFLSGLVVAGCDGGLAVGDADATTPADFAAQRVLVETDLVPGAVTLRTPRGYCIDGDSQRSGSRAFALIAACDLLRGTPALNVDPVVMTVTAQAATGPLPSATTLAGLVGADAVLEEIAGDGLTLVRLEGGTPGPLVDGSPQHWRAMLQVNGHLTLLALFAPEGSALADRAGLVLIGALAAEIRAASTAATAGAAPARPAAADPSKTPQQAEKT